MPFSNSEYNRKSQKVDRQSDSDDDRIGDGLNKIVKQVYRMDIENRMKHRNSLFHSHGILFEREGQKMKYE